jgi:hypothetical protein
MPYSSVGFQAFKDEFRRDGSALVRHLVSIRLSEVSPVSQPAYFDTSTAIRSLAGQVGEDPEDVAALAERGELRSLFTRTDLSVAAPPTVPPGVTEHRSGEPSSGSVELELRRKLSDERAKRLGYDKPVDPRARLLTLYRRKSEWDAPVEARSLYHNPWDASTVGNYLPTAKRPAKSGGESERVQPQPWAGFHGWTL